MGVKELAQEICNLENEQIDSLARELSRLGVLNNVSTRLLSEYWRVLGRGMDEALRTAITKSNLCYWPEKKDE